MKTRFSKFVKRIAGTQVFEIDCSACLDHISQFVDLELSGADAAGQLPLIRQHLNQCGVCHEEYLVLRELAQMERENRSPSTSDLSDSLQK